MIIFSCISATQGDLLTTSARKKNLRANSKTLIFSVTQMFIIQLRFLPGIVWVKNLFTNIWQPKKNPPIDVLEANIKSNGFFYINF